MPVELQKADLVAQLAARAHDALKAADVDNNDFVDPGERRSLPRDLRLLTTNTADAYLRGGPLPIGPFVEAYRLHVAEEADLADPNDTGTVIDTDLPAHIFSGVASMRAGVSRTTGSLDDLYRQLSRGGFNDDKLMQFVTAADRRGELRDYGAQLVKAAMNPEMPRDDHTGATFFETLAWYNDATVVKERDGYFTRDNCMTAIEAAAKKYLDLAINHPAEIVPRLQAWKNVQKLRLLEAQIDERELAGQGAFYPYRARAMMTIDKNSPWNRANTVDSRAEFQDRVIRGSHDKPVLVKFGLTYCMHCLLLEQLGSVPAVDKKYGGDIDVVKLWWNPRDPAMAEITRVAQEQGVTSSPFFIVYENGEPVSQGYAFPDENGNGVEGLLRDVL